MSASLFRSQAAPVLLACVLVASCVPPGQRFEQLAERDATTALDRSTRWLENHSREHPRWQEVATAQAKAAFSLASDMDNVQAWRGYQRSYPRPVDLLSEAQRREATAAYRDMARRQDTLSSYQYFRAAYPDSAEVEDARRREVALALTAAETSDGIEPLQAFRRAYADWPEAETERRQVLALEMARALASAKEAGTTRALRSWLASYADSDVAPEVVAEAHVLAGRALANEAIAALLASEWDVASLAKWRSENDELPALAEVATARRDALAARAEEAESTEAWLLVAHLLRGTAEGPALLERARTLAWDAAADPARAGDFSKQFPDDPRAWDAEGRWLAWRERTAPRARQARVQRRRTLPNGEIELTVDVVDCEGRRLAGLTRASFALWDGEDRVPISAFTSLEQERPLEIAVAVDLSGSMATERAAVDAAVERFAETLRFRNRSVEIGLVGFSDGVVVNEAPSARTSDFRRWLRDMPGNGGGGAEDTAGGILAGIEQVRRGRGERVVVLLSDERLQVNLHGRRALGLEETSCDEARSVGGCLGSCGSDATCFGACIANGPPRYARLLSGCGSRPGSYCTNTAVQRALGDISSCQTVRDHPELPGVVAGRLGKAEVRTYVLATAAESDGYLELATTSGGRLVPVPDDTTDPAPYEEALLDIADQLSKQYVVTYRPVSSALPEPVVSPEWRWAEEPIPSDSLPGVTRLTLEDGHPAQVKLESDGSISRSLDDTTWREVLAADPGRRELVLASLGSPAVCTDGGASLWCSRDLGRTWDAVERPGTEGEMTIYGTATGLYARQGGDTWRLLRVLSRDLPASALYFQSNSDGFEPTLEPFLQELGESLQARPELRLRVEGHADARGSDAYNDDLALRRAARTAEAVRARGGRADQLVVKSFGERRPVRSGNTQADYQRNRRVEMILLEPPPPDEEMCR